MKYYSLADIEKIIQPLKIVGNKDVLFNNAKTLAEADKNSIVWIKPKMPDKESQADLTNSSMIIVYPSFKISKKINVLQVESQLAHINQFIISISTFKCLDQHFFFCTYS